MPHRVTHHKGNWSHIDHSGLLQEISWKTPKIYFEFQVFESSQSLDEKVEQFILEAISWNGKSGVAYFQWLLLAYSVLEYHREFDKIDSNHPWYISLEEKLATLIENQEEYLIGEEFIDRNSGLGIGKRDQWGFLWDITLRVHEQLVK